LDEADYAYAAIHFIVNGELLATIPRVPLVGANEGAI
jgi:hypothetical protein